MATSESKCLFCKLKNNKDNILYENDFVYAILDRYPSSTPHILIITKICVPYLHETTDDYLKEAICVAKRIALKLNLKSYNILQNNEFGQLIKHFHLHVTAANDSGNFTRKPNKSISDLEYKKQVEKFHKIISK